MATIGSRASAAANAARSFPPGEVGQVVGQRPRHDPGRRRRRRIELAPHQTAVQLAQRRAGVDTQLVGERTPQPGVGGQRVGRAALPGQRDHQVRVEVLPPRPSREHAGKYSTDPRRAVRGTVRAELDCAPPFQCTEASFVPGLGRRGQVDAVDPCQRVTPPQRQGAFDRRRVATREQFVSLVGVQPVFVEPDAVTDALDRLDEPRQPAPHFGDGLVDLLARRARWLAVPQGRHERVERDGLAPGQQEPGQEATRSRPTDGDFARTVVDRQRAQDAQLHTADGIPDARRAGRCPGIPPGHQRDGSPHSGD
jgi:hypothetical protein